MFKNFFFSNMRQVCEEEQRAAAGDPNRQPRPVFLQFTIDSTRDQRRYNAPTANEVAAVFVGEHGLPPDNVDLVIYEKNPRGDQHMQTISRGSKHADPMLYPLFFPYGESGWQFNIPQVGNRRNRVRNSNSIREFTCYRLAIRYDGNNVTRHQNFSAIHNSGFCFQQYVVDLYTRMEANNLAFININQGQLFAEAYNGLMDHVN